MELRLFTLVCFCLAGIISAVPPEQLVSQMCQDVKGGIQIRTPETFRDLTDQMETMTESEIRSIQRVADSCSSQQLKDLVNDAILSAAGPGTISILAEKIQELPTAKQIYFATNLAMAKNPNEQTIKAMSKLAKVKGLSRHVVLGMSAYINGFCQSDCEKPGVVNEFMKNLENEIAQVCSSQNPQDQQRAKVLLTAAGNIPKTDNPQTVMKCAENQQNDNIVRRLALFALQKGARDPQVQRTLQKIAMDENDDETVRIAAFLVSMSEASASEAQQLMKRVQQSDSKQVACYASSWLQNVKDSQKPSKQELKEKLGSVSTTQGKHQCETGKDSRNYEFSFVPPQLEMGLAVEGNLVMDEQDNVPKYVDGEIAVPVMDKEIQLFQIMIHQEDLLNAAENSMDKFIETVQEQGLTAAIEQLIRQFRSANVRNQRATIGYQTHARGRIYKSGKETGKVSVAIGVNGKTVLYIDEQDLQQISSQEIQSMIESVKQAVQNPSQYLKNDAALGFNFLNNKYTVTSKNGTQAEVELDGTTLLGYTGQGNTYQPSFATDIQMKINYGQGRGGMKSQLAIQSSPKIRISASGSQITFDFPDGKLNLLTMKHQTVTIDRNGRKQRVPDSSQGSFGGCTDALKKPLNMEICAQSQLSTSQSEAQIQLIKSEKSAQGWKVSLEMPQGSGNAVQTYKALFDTPGSQTNRLVSAEVQLGSSQRDEQAIKATLRAPGNKVIFQARKVWNSQKQQVDTRMEINNEVYEAQVGLTTNRKDKKVEYVPLLKLNSPQMTPVEMTGSIILDLNRRTQLIVDLKPVNGNSPSLKGNLVKDAGKVSANANVRVGNFAGRTFAAFEVQSNVASADVKFDYQVGNRNKQNVQFSAKKQFTVTGGLQKTNLVYEQRFSFNSDLNLHVSVNAMQKPKKHAETEINIMHKKFDDERRKITILQVSRVNSQGNLFATQNILQVKWPMANIDLNLEGKLHADQSQTPKFRVELVANEKASNNKFESFIDYKQPSKKPLRMSIEAVGRYNNKEVKYSDKLEEIAANEYKGKTQVKWPSKHAGIEYHYKVRSDNYRTSHELNTQFKTSQMRHATQHQALLRMSKTDIEIRSKLQHDGAPLWDLNSLFSSGAKSRILLDLPVVVIKTEASPFERSRTAMIELTGKSTPFHHQSDFALEPRAIVFNTKTTYRKQPVFTLSSLLGASQSRVSVDSTPLFGSFNYNAETSTASLELRSKDNSINHKTNVNAASNQLVVTSKTQSNGQVVADLDVALAQTGESHINVETQSVKAAVTYANKPDGLNAAIKASGKNGKYNHRSSLVVTRRAINIVSNQQWNRREIYDLNAQLAKSGPSKISVNTQDWKTAAEVDPSNNRGKINVQSSGLEHTTNVNLGRQQWSLDSNTVRQGRPVAQIKARLADTSVLKVDTEPLDIDFEVQKNNVQLTAQYNPMRIVHKSRWSNKPRGFDLSSKTEQSGQMIVEYIVNVNEDARSLYKVAYKQFSAQVEYDAQAHSAQFQINGQPIRFSHITDINWVPEKQWSMDSKSNYRGRPVFTINTLASAYGKSHFKFSKSGYEGSFELSHKTKAKTARVVLKQSNPFVSHESEIEYHPGQHLVITSNTDANQNRLAGFSSRIAGSGPSHVKIVVPMGSAGFVMEPQQVGKLIRVELERQTGIPISHITKISYQPSGVTVLSSSTKHGGRNVFDVKSQLSGSRKSFLNVQTLPANLAFELDPTSTSRTAYVKLEGLNTPFLHESELGYQPRRQVSIVSQTRSGQQELFNLKSLLSLVGPSHVRVVSSPYSGELRVQPFASSKVFGLSLADAVRAMNHEAEIKYQPGNSVTFNVVRKQRNVPVYTLNSHMSNQLKSFINWEAGHQLANLEVEPFSQSKNVKFVYHDKRSDYKSVNQGSWLPGELRFLNEATEKGRMFAKLNALLSSMGESSLDTASPFHTSVLRVLPFGSQRYLTVQSKHLRFPAEHTLEINEVPTGVLIKSLATQRGQPIFDLSSLFSGSQKSHIKVVSPVVVANGEIDPFSAQKKALFSLNYPQEQYDHLTEIQLEPGLLKMSAKSTNKGQKSFHTETLIQKSGLSTFKTHNKYFDAEASYESKPLLKISYTPKNHQRRQAEFLVGRKDVTKNNVDLSFTWDASNPEAKIELSAAMEPVNARSRQPIIKIKGVVGQNSHFSLEGKMGESLIAGPHDLTIATRDQQGVTSLVLHHHVRNGQVQCTAQLIKNGQVKLEFENEMSVESQRDGAKVKANIQVKSDYKAVDGLLLTVNHEHRSNYLMSEIVARAPGSEKAIFRAEYSGNLDSRNGNLKGKLSVKLPGQQNQQLAVQSNWGPRQVQLMLEGIDNEGKKARLQGEYDIQSSRSQTNIKGKLGIKSDYESIDGLSIALSTTHGSGSLSAEASAQLPQQRQPANIQVKVNGRGSIESGNVNAQLSANLPGTGRQEINGQATWSGNQGDLSLTAKDSSSRKTSVQGQYRVHGSNIKANLVSKSDYPEWNNYKVTLTNEPSERGIRTEALVQIPNSEPAVVRSNYNANLDSRSGNLNWDVKVNLPSRQYVNQELHLRSKWNQQQGELNLETVANSGKKVQLQGQYNNQRDGVSGSLNLDSGFDAIPDVKAEGSLRTSASRPEAKLNVDVDKERVVEVAASGNIRDSENFRGQAMVDTWATPKINLDVEGRQVDSRNTKYSAVVKREGENIMEAKVNKGERSSKGQLFTNGSEWVNVETNPIGTPEGTQRVFAQMRGAKHPLKIQYSPRWALY